MSADAIELYDYLIHEGQIEGEPACALLWTGRDWPLSGECKFSICDAEGGFKDLVIEAEEGCIRLKSIEKPLLSIICDRGLYVIYPDVAGSQHLHIPPQSEDA